MSRNTTFETRERPHTHTHTHYDVLQLPRHGDWPRLSKEDIRAAYRGALLLHHPDKARQRKAAKPLNGSYTPAYSIDEIVLAYEVLVDPKRRAEYDAALDRGDTSLGWMKEEKDSGGKGSHIGVEVYDLEDLNYDEDKSIWIKSCRCGDEQGYILTESDLDNESSHGEIYVGCRGCSLFVMVLFAVDEG